MSGNFTATVVRKPTERFHSCRQIASRITLQYGHHSVYPLQRGHRSCPQPPSQLGTGSGFNWRALLALAIGIAPNIPGFLAQASGGAIDVPQFFEDLYVHAWFVSLLLAGTVHIGLSLMCPAITARGVAGRVEQAPSVKV
jgi:hypothetical protein